MIFDQLNDLLRSASTFWVLAIIAFLLFLIYDKVSATRNKRK